METMKTTRAAAIVQRAREAIPGGSSAGFMGPTDVPLVLERGEGAVVWDIEGRNWVDYILGSGPLILGHAHPVVVQAVREQIERGFTFYALNEACVALAEQVNAAMPSAEQTKFTSTGSEATFYALRLARAATGRDLVVKLEGGYHGHHDVAVMSMAPKRLIPFPDASADSAGTPVHARSDVLIAPFNSADALAGILSAHKSEIAAVLIEPYQRAIPPVPGYLERVRQLTRDAGVVLIFDEIVTGFRLAYGGAQEYYGVTPDLSTVGKILGGGFPLAAVCGAREVMQLSSMERRGEADFVYFSGTLNGNPVGAVAGLATLAELRRPGTYERLFSAGERMRAGLRRVLADRGVRGTVLGVGPMFYVEYADGPITDYRSAVSGDKGLMRRVGDEMIRNGHLWNPIQRNYISTAHSSEQIDATIEAFGLALDVAVRA